MLNQRKQDERRSLEAAQLSLLNKTIESQDKRIKALESLLARSADYLTVWDTWAKRVEDDYSSETHNKLMSEIDAILPKTEEVK